MKSTSASNIKRFITSSFVILFCVFAKLSFGQNNAKLTYRWERPAGFVELKKNGNFVCTDTNFLALKSGNWSANEKTISFSNTLDTILCDFHFLNESKIVFKKKSGQSFYYVESKIRNNLGLSLHSVSRGLMGLIFILLFAYALSRDRKSINWNLVIKGMLLQLVLAFLILKVPFVEGFFDFLSKGFTKVIYMSHDGAAFLFSSVINGELSPTVLNFVTWILPSVIFFSALSSLLYYWGILQRFVYGMAWVMYRLMGLSGAESVAAAGNVFLGQTEAPLLVKPYLGKMTKSELLSLMVGGMATIAGGVLASYISFLGNGDPVKELYFAKHLLTASLMSAPAAIVFAKMLYPEKEEVLKNLEVSQEKLGGSSLEAIANGTTDGVKLAVNVAAMLLVFTSLISLLNYILTKLGYITGLNDLIALGGVYDALSFQFLMGNIFAPIAWLIGVTWQDALLFGQLLGEKTILNEFIAYKSLGESLQDRMTQKSVLMATYALCGFANFASIGIQIGGIGALAPERKAELAKFGVTALIGGTLACLSTAILVGMIF